MAEKQFTVYGIKNCNTVKSALDWLKKHEVPFEFHDYKSKGISETKLKSWTKQVEVGKSVNQARYYPAEMDEATQAKVKNDSSAIALMQEKTSVIKRPLIEADGKVVTLGFDEDSYKSCFRRIFDCARTFEPNKPTKIAGKAKKQLRQ